MRVEVHVHRVRELVLTTGDPGLAEGLALDVRRRQRDDVTDLELVHLARSGREAGRGRDREAHARGDEHRQGRLEHSRLRSLRHDPALQHIVFKEP